MPAGGRASPFDRNKVEHLSNETAIIQALLAARKPLDPAPAIRRHNPPSLTCQPPGGATKPYGAILDDRHQGVLQELLTRPKWAKAELQTVTSRFGLMPWACLKTLNEWACEYFGDLLLEGGEVVAVNPSLIPIIKT